MVAAIAKRHNVEYFGTGSSLRAGHFQLLIRSVYSAEEAEETAALCVSAAGTSHVVGQTQRAAGVS